VGIWLDTITCRNSSGTVLSGLRTAVTVVLYSSRTGLQTLLICTSMNASIAHVRDYSGRGQVSDDVV
jgi:hypothetical protein